MTTRRQFLKTVLWSGLAVGTGLGLDGLCERSTFDVTEFDLAAGSQSCLRVAFMSDLHRSLATPRWVLERAVAVCQSLQADVILLGGDYVSSARDLPLVPECAEILGRLRAPRGVFYVLGNHDYWAGPNTLHRYLQAAGLTDLTNTSTRLTSGIHLIGVDDVWMGLPSIERAFQGTEVGTRLVFSHNPRVFPMLRSRDCVVVCGHTHGGQINIPGVPNPCLRSWKTYIRGWFHEENSSMYVNRGAGTLTLPFRVNCLPEITVLRIPT